MLPRRSVIRYVQQIFEQAVTSGFAEEPPVDTTFRRTAEIPPPPPELIERNNKLRKRWETSDDDFAREVLQNSIRLEKLWIKRIYDKAKERVLKGRPYVTVDEALAANPPRLIDDLSVRADPDWDGKIPKIHRQYPPMTDRELLGEECYKALIEERVAKFKEKYPDATPAAIWQQENPGALPYVRSTSQPGAGRKSRSFTLWVDIADEDRYRAVLWVCLVGAAYYKFPRGRGVKDPKKITSRAKLISHALQCELTFPIEHPRHRSLVHAIHNRINNRLHYWDAPYAMQRWNVFRETIAGPLPDKSEDVAGWVAEALLVALELTKAKTDPEI